MKNKHKEVKAWAVERVSDNTLFDDGEEVDGKLLILYPIFKKKDDAILYIRKTYSGKYGRGLAKAIPCTITYSLPTRTNKKKK